MAVNGPARLPAARFEIRWTIDAMDNCHESASRQPRQVAIRPTAQSKINNTLRISMIFTPMIKTTIPIVQRMPILSTQPQDQQNHTEHNHGVPPFASPITFAAAGLHSRSQRSGGRTPRSGSVDKPVMGAFCAGSYEVTPPGRSRATTSSTGPTDRPKDSTARQAYGESDPAEDVIYILTGLRNTLA